MRLRYVLIAMLGDVMYVKRANNGEVIAVQSK